MNSGKRAVLVGAYKNKEREEGMVFNDFPIMYSEEVFISKKGRKIVYKTMDDLNKYSIVHVRKGLHGDKFDKFKWKNLEDVGYIIQGLKMVVKGKWKIIKSCRYK